MRAPQNGTTVCASAAREREDEGEMTDLDNHCVAAVVPFLPAALLS